MPRVATYRVQIGLGGGIGGRFRIGHSTIGGTDILTNAFTEFFNGPNDTVTNDVHGVVSISRGRDVVLGSTHSGRCAFDLCRPDDPDFYNPNAPTSPLASLDPGFEAMRPVRVQASLDGGLTWHGQFYGFIRTATYDVHSRVCAIVAEDLFLWLSRRKPLIASASGLTTAQAIGKILDGIEWTDPALRSLSTLSALSNLTFAADRTKDALTLIRELLAAEQGVCFVDGDGVFVFDDRYARDRRRTAVTTFATALNDAESKVDLDKIRNIVTVTDAGDVAVTVEDTASQQDYGEADADGVSSDYLPSGSGGSLANLILQRIKDSHPPVVATIDNEDEATLTQQLTLEPEQRIAVNDTLGGTTGDYFIERLQHDINPSGWHHETRYLISKAPATQAFIIGTSKIADPDIIGA
jgi:hypothetical protein